ncbi:MAG: Fur family transcriptional regulator [Opitutales bacterium]
METLPERLRDAGYRMTQPRRQLMKILQGAERPLSAEEILAAAGTSAIDLVTVYRNLAIFGELGLIQTIQLETGKQLFELQESENDHHHHIICRSCHGVVRLDLCFGAELEKYARSLGFTQLSHTIEVFGLCADCAGAEN